MTQKVSGKRNKLFSSATILLTISDLCWENFKRISNEADGLMSTCKVQASYFNVSTDVCKLYACDMRANTINYRSSNCTVLKCVDYDPKLTPVNQGWDVYQTTGIFYYYQICQLST